MRSRLCPLPVLLLACFTAQSFAMPNRQKLKAQPCNIVWRAAVIGVKSQQYRIVSVSDEHRLISVSVGGWWCGDRLISVSLEDAGETQCMVTVQSHFSGLLHHDGPALLSRIGAELRRETENSRIQPPADAPPKEHMQGWWQPAEEKKQ
jgi:hypothetical protein